MPGKETIEQPEAAQADITAAGRQDVILIAAGPGAMLRARLDAPAVIASDGLVPPVCGSCHHFSGGLCRQHREAVKPSDVSCTAHQWQSDFERLTKLIGQFRLTGQAWIVRELQKSFHEADDKEARHLQALELGLRPAVKLEAMDTAQPVPTKVIAPDGTGQLDVSWVGEDGYLDSRGVRTRAEF